MCWGFQLLRADRDRSSAAARERWAARAAGFGFDSLAATWLSAELRVRVELGCGGSTAARLLHVVE
ncbi:hypothetical protein [Nocardioides sp. 31GB23]|uniref:hypothetical protein n=1 Tax=Nocardioides sp. 31GB23 TaxID=3156065 RepID=UPI0032B0100B